MAQVPNRSAAKAEQSPVDENAKARSISLRIVTPFCRACSRFASIAEISSHPAIENGTGVLGDVLWG
jgi:hypothetical protein